MTNEIKPARTRVTPSFAKWCRLDKPGKISTDFSSAVQQCTECVSYADMLTPECSPELVGLL